MNPDGNFSYPYFVPRKQTCFNVLTMSGLWKCRSTMTHLVLRGSEAGEPMGKPASGGNSRDLQKM